MIVHLSVTGAAPGPVTALAGVGGSVVQTLTPLAGVSGADTLVALLNVPASLSSGNHRAAFRTLDDQVKNTASEACVEWEVVR